MRRLVALTAVLMVASILVTPAAAGGGCHRGPGAVSTTAATTDAEAAKCGFEPTVIYVEPGETVTWTNRDPVPHSVTGANLEWGTEKLLEDGDSISYTFESEGTFPYYCLLHPGMVGAVVVGDGRGKISEASVSQVIAKADPKDPTGAGANLDSARTSDAGAPGWLIPAGIAAAIGVMYLAAMPLRRRRRPEAAVPNV